MSYRSLITLVQQDVYELLSAKYGPQFGDAVVTDTKFPFLLIDEFEMDVNRVKNGASWWSLTMRLAAVTSRDIQGHQPVNDLVNEAADLVVCNAISFPLKNESEGELVGKYMIRNAYSTPIGSNRGMYDNSPSWTATAVVTFQISRR